MSLLLLVMPVMAVAEENKLDEKWLNLSDGVDKSVLNLIEFIDETETGSQMIQDGLVRTENKSKKDLAKLIRPAIKSYTDSIIEREIDIKKNFNNIKSSSQIFIGENLTYYDASIDLVHELTHLAFKSYFNPYEKSFNLLNFLMETIEGRGGEVSAVVNECTMSMELYIKFGRKIDNVCRSYFDSKGRVVRAKIRKDFYKVGKYYTYMKKYLDKAGITDKFPYLSGGKPVFISGVAKAPYPVSTIYEYVSVKDMACKNNCNLAKKLDKKRLSRTLASVEEYISEVCGKCIK